jgi:hypothetical protein
MLHYCERTYPSTILFSQNTKPSTKRPVQVHFWTGSSLENFSPTNFLIEGVERSQYLKLVHVSFLESNNIIKFARLHSDRDRKVPLIWMVDLWGLGHDCHALETLLVHAQQVETERKHKPLLLLIDYSRQCRTTNTMPQNPQNVVGEKG